MFARIHLSRTNKSHGAILILGWLLILGIGILDYAARQDLDIHIFYVLPVCQVVWFANPRAGIITAAGATATWSAINRATGQLSQNWTILLWNAGVEFGILLVIIGLLSMLKQRAHQLEKLADQDPLTRVANRRCFFRAVDLEINRCRRHGLPFTLVYLDLDNFKAVNDLYGHTAGDTVLCQIAARIQQNLRALDMVGRVGGDEFAILLPQIEAEAAKHFVTRLQRLLRRTLADKSKHLTLSLGSVTFSRPPASSVAVIEQVDRLMYSVKKGGKNGAAFGVWPEPSPGGTTMLTNPLLHSLAKAPSQLKLMFHPGDLVRPRTNDATLCEVLGAEDAERIRVRGLDWLPGYSAIIPAKEIYLVSRVDANALKGAG